MKRFLLLVFCFGYGHWLVADETGSYEVFELLTASSPSDSRSKEWKPGDGLSLEVSGMEWIGPDRLDGLTVPAETWWFNVRASNTEPLLRLNVEADTEAEMTRVRDEVLSLVRQ